MGRGRVAPLAGRTVTSALRRIDPAAGQVVAADSSLREHRDALYMPFGPNGIDADTEWGIYDQGGALAQDAAYCRGPARTPVGQRPHMAAPADIADAPDETYIYAGPLILHYGHFLLATLSRFWPYAGGAPHGPKFLWHAHCDPLAVRDYPYITATLGALGLTPDRFVRFTRPTRIRRLIVPAPAFEEGHCVHVAFQRLCRGIGAPFAVKSGPRPPAYLARTQLTAGVKNFSNEAALAETLERMGVELLFPEAMPFSEQVALFASDRVVMGVGGSGFHTAIFAPPAARLVILHVAPSDNQALLDQVNGHRTLSLEPCVPAATAPTLGRFLVTLALADPTGTAADLLRAAQSMQ